jgi:drug/metabolite transporter (DMT)-like permease
MSRTQTALLAIIASFLWSTAFIGIKIGLPYTTPLQFAGVRFMLAGLILLPFTGVSFRAYREMIRDNYPVIIKIAFLQTTILYTLFYLGVARVPSYIGAIMTGTSPLWAMLLSHYLMKNDTVTPRKAVSFIFGFGGIVLIALQKGGGGTGSLYLGITLMIFASISSGLASVFIAKDNKNLAPLPLNALQLFLGGLILFVISIFVEGIGSIPTSANYYYSLIYLSLLSATAFSIWFYLLKQPNVKISFLNIWKFVIPVSGAIISWIVFPDESPTVRSILGMVLVAGSILLYNLNLKKRA